jgi:hypothetical protein
MTNVVRVNDRARLRRRALPGLRIDSRPGLNVDRPGLPDRRLRSLPSPSKRTPRRCCADSSARAATAMRLVTAVVIAMAAGADGAGAGGAADAPTRKPVARYDAASSQLVRRSNKSSIISRAAAQISVNLTGPHGAARIARKLWSIDNSAQGTAYARSARRLGYEPLRNVI